MFNGREVCDDSLSLTLHETICALQLHYKIMARFFYYLGRKIMWSGVTSIDKNNIKVGNVNIMLDMVLFLTQHNEHFMF